MSFRTAFSFDGKIGWFPGHMAKALRQIRERIDSCDFVFDVRDARVPVSSTNPIFEDLLRRKRRIIIYNKSDLSDKSIKEVLKILCDLSSESV